MLPAQLLGALAARHQGWTASNVDAASAKMLTDVCVCVRRVCVSASLSACALPGACPRVCACVAVCARVCQNSRDQSPDQRRQSFTPALVGWGRLGWGTRWVGFGLGSGWTGPGGNGSGWESWSIRTAKRTIVMLNFEVDGKSQPGSPESGAEVRDQGTGLLWGCGPKV